MIPDKELKIPEGHKYKEAPGNDSIINKSGDLNIIKKDVNENNSKITKIKQFRHLEKYRRKK